MSRIAGNRWTRLSGWMIVGVLALNQIEMANAAGKPVKAYTNPEQTDEDFKFQGEYSGEITQPDGAKGKLGAQFRALGDGNFRTMFFVGGLPGDGWDGKTILEKAPSTDSAVPTDAKREGDKVVVDHVVKATCDGKKVTGQTSAGAKFELARVDRTSPTQGAKPPAGALVLFDGAGVDQWQPGAGMTPEKHLKFGVRSKKKLQDFSLHLEFMISYAPATQGIGQRPNSGVYLQSRYEIQILDSFGVTMRAHDCGVLYGQIIPKVNMCYPTLRWQTYDIDFKAAKYDSAGKKEKNARCTVKLNGVTILDDVEILHSTGGGGPETPAPESLHLQAHGMPVFFRNIWVVEK